MIEKDKVKNYLSELAGLDADEIENTDGICAATVIELEAMLRDDIDYPMNSERICYAAAAMAFYKYCAVMTASDSGGFKAGSLTVSEKSADNVSLAKSIRDDGLDMISDLLKNRSFAFVTV